MATSIEKLMKLKKEIDQAKLDKASLEGVYNENLQRLKSEFEVKDLVGAKKKLSAIEKELDELDSKIDELVQNLEENYQW